MVRESLSVVIYFCRTGEVVTVAPKQLRSAVIYIQENDLSTLSLCQSSCGMLYYQNIGFYRIDLLRIILILATTTQ